MRSQYKMYNLNFTALRVCAVVCSCGELTLRKRNMMAFLKMVVVAVRAERKSVSGFSSTSHHLSVVHTESHILTALTSSPDSPMFEGVREDTTASTDTTCSSTLRHRATCDHEPVGCHKPW